MAPALVAAALLAAAPRAGELVPLRRVGLALERPAQVVAEVRARCARCDWSKRGREAAVLRLSLDGAYAQHLVLARGSGSYRVAIGRLDAGQHFLDVALEPGLSCRGVGAVTVDDVGFEPAPAGSAQEEALAHAPLLYLREDVLKRFTDLPLVMWYETDSLPQGRRLRYSVIFSNEDGGTPPDRLMATWGRVTDIEYVYGVELGGDGRVLREEYQGKDHVLPAFTGRHQDARPLLWVVTRNNMVGETGETTVRVSPEPLPFDLTGVSREAVMDAQPWTYQVSAAEVRREGRVKGGAVPGSKQIPDPRRFTYVEGCADMSDAGVAFAVGVRHNGRTEWTWSDAGTLQWRISRSRDSGENGCFRGAVALPHPGAPLAGLRFRSYPRGLRRGETALPAGAGRSVLRSVTRVFRLRGDDTPGPSLMSWQGELALEPGAPPVDVPIDEPIHLGGLGGEAAQRR